MATAQVVVLGGGLSGVSAANTVLENSGRVILLDKSAFCGGNSSKATSGINGANTRAQRNKQITDSTELFISDTKKGGAKKPDLVEVLCANSGTDVEWLMDTFALDLSLVARLGGHSQPRTHRGKERFPGMTITYALIQMLENVAESNPDKARIITKAQANKLIMDDAGACVGCRYLKDGSECIADGPVIICTGGFGADFTQNSLLAQHRPDLLHLPTTNGMHCTGDGIKMGMEIGASTIDLEWVQVHPTGLVKPDEPDSKIKFLAAEALRGVGGLVLDANGKRFCNELGRRDYVTGEMWKNTPPFRLVLNYAASEEIIWHCKHYTGRGVMKMFESGEALAKEMGIDVSVLENTHAIHYEAAKKTEADPDGGPFPAYPSGRSWDEPSGKTNSGKKFYHNIIDASAVRTQRFFAAIITPVIHYCMGGLEINTDSLVTTNGKAIPGLYAAGEVAGGVHGNNRLGGNSLLDCVVFGRVAGKHAVKYLLGAQAIPISLSQLTGTVGNVVVTEKAPVPVKAAVSSGDGYSMEEVQKHNSNTDCWVVLHGRVLNVTSFLKEHPGGELAIMTFAGKDATKEFDMIHPPGVVEKYAPNAVIGKLAVEASAPAATSGGQVATTAAGVPPGMSRVLIVGGSFAGLCVGRDMKSRFHVTIVDAKEYFEYTPGILRAYVKPKHFDALTFTLAPVIERRMCCKFIWGEVMAIDGHARTATVKPMFLKTTEMIDFDYCVIAAGCNFGPFHPCGQSLWFPTVQQEYREKGDWAHIDERYIEGRRRHLLEEYHRLCQLEAKAAKILIVGMGFIGVEWATEIKHFFPKMSITMCDMAPNCLGPLPKSAATYCEKYLKKNDIKFFYETGYAPKEKKFWDKIDLPDKADYEYICVGVKASNTFMPEETLTERGKWIAINKFLAVTTRDNEVWSFDGSDSRVYAIGDCNAACVGQRDSGEVNARGQKIFAYDINPIPKISYPGEEEAVIVSKNIKKIDKTNRGVPCKPPKGMHWPWGAGWFATSLGPHDACFVSGANWKPGSGGCIVWGGLSAVQKEVIEASKVDECKYGFIGRCIWHFVHHTPLHLFGGGPKFGY